MDTSSIEVGTSKDKAFIKIKGRGDFLNSQALKDFLQTMIQKGLTDFLLDLQDCKTMDSTFMGVLAGAALQLKNKHQKKLTLFHVDEHNMQLLTTLGIHIFMNILLKAPSTPSDFESLPQPSISKHKMAQQMLDAHSILMDISEENRIKFKDVFEYLKDELKRTSS